MPNPKSGTVTFDIKDAVADTKAGKVEYRLDKGNIIHVPVGKVSFGEEKLYDNLITILRAIIKLNQQLQKVNTLEMLQLLQQWALELRLMELNLWKQLKLGIKIVTNLS